jgi:hypothetical protein
MLHHIEEWAKEMARGTSGRIIIEIDPEFKHELYDALQKENLTLKEWFLRNADKYLSDRGQLDLPLSNNESSRKVG